MQSHNRPWVFLSLLLVCLLALGALSALWAPSAQAVLPPRPSVVLPEEDEARPAPTPRPAVAQIYLRVTPADQAYWAVVQWQDARGRWHDVSGWRGEITQGQVSWWVEEKDFGKGPFRWAVYPSGGPIVEQGGRTFPLLRGEADLGRESALLAACTRLECGRRLGERAGPVRVDLNR